MGFLIIAQKGSIRNLLTIPFVAGAFNTPFKTFTFLLWVYATALDVAQQLIFINPYKYFLEMPHTLTSWDSSV